MKGRLKGSITGLVILIPALCLLVYGFYSVATGSDSVSAGIAVGIGMFMAIFGCWLVKVGIVG